MSLIDRNFMPEKDKQLTNQENLKNNMDNYFDSFKGDISSLKNKILENVHKSTENKINWLSDSIKGETNSLKELKENILEGLKQNPDTNIEALVNLFKEEVSDLKDEIMKGFKSSAWNFKILKPLMSRKQRNLSRPVDAIGDAYQDVIDQIDEGIYDKNIIARGLALAIKYILQNGR